MSSTVTALPRIGMMVVAVHAEDPDPPAVDEQVTVADLDGAEADELSMDLGDRAVGVEQLGDHAVSGRRLGRPRVDAGELEPARGDVPAEHVRLGESVRHRRRDRRRQPAAAECLDGRTHRPTRRRRARPADRRRHVERAVAVGEPGTRRRKPARRRASRRDRRARPRGAAPPSTTGPGPRRSCGRCSARPRSPGRCGRRRDAA